MFTVHYGLNGNASTYNIIRRGTIVNTGMLGKILEKFFSVGTKSRQHLVIIGKGLRLVFQTDLRDCFLRIKNLVKLRNTQYSYSNDISIYNHANYIAPSKLIDIIVPVYNGFKIVEECLESIFLNTLNIPYRVIVVDDNSDDNKLNEYLNTLEACRKNVIILHNGKNIGFVKSVNRGLTHCEGDIVILNSDTVVTFDWLRKLYSCAYSDVKMATVTPLSNNAEICSVPEFCKNNIIPRGYTIQEFANLVEKTATQITLAYHQLPVGVGFCMYIKKSVINEIGIFDEAFGMGYGEEIDFCLRASSRGYFHTVCPFVFVFHRGKASFGEGQEQLRSNNTRILVERYPDYRDRIAGFIIKNPLLSFQKALHDNLSKLEK
jgi:GT2 family glycosyltransferase